MFNWDTICKGIKIVSKRDSHYFFKKIPKIRQQTTNTSLNATKAPTSYDVPLAILPKP